MNAHRTLRRVVLLALLPGGLAACGEDAPKGPSAPAPDVILEIDGLRVTRAELEDWHPYLDALDPRLGKGFRNRQILEQHLMPMKFAQRLYAVHRAELRTRAEALVKVAPTLAELVEVSKKAEEPRERGYSPTNPSTRADLPIALARAAFDRKKLGQVQGPIETPQGFAIVATRKIDPGVTAFEDRADPWLVLFNTHMSREFDEWWRKQRESIRASVRATYVHPDFKDSLPDWIQT